MMPRAATFIASLVLSTLFTHIFLISLASAQLPSGWRAHDKSRPEATVVDPGPATAAANVPSDAIVLFDGTDLSKWQNMKGKAAGWKIVDGAMESVKGSGYVATKEKFGDCQLHVEWASPATVKGNGQGRGNSGVFLMGDFEVQVLDSFENPTYVDGSAGSIYGQFPPLANASRKPGEWQTYDIIFQAPKFNEAKELTSPARITVLHNGVLIQNHSEAYGPTSWIQKKNYAFKTEGPLSLQDHGNPVRYRNIWIRPLEANTAVVDQYPKEVELSPEAAQKYVGTYGGRKVELVDGVLKLSFAGSKLDLVPHGEDSFGMRFSAGDMKFEMDGDKAVSLTLAIDATGKSTLKRDEEPAKKD